MKTLTAEEVKSQIERLLKSWSDIIERLSKLNLERQAKLVEVNKKAIEKFNKIYGGRFEESQARLNVEWMMIKKKIDELRCLCPNKGKHTKPKGKYMHCPTCGYVWDDTSDAHP